MADDEEDLEEENLTEEEQEPETPPSQAEQFARKKEGKAEDFKPENKQDGRVFEEPRPEKQEKKEYKENVKNGVKRSLEAGLMQTWYDYAEMWLEIHKSDRQIPQDVLEDHNKVRKLDYAEKNGAFVDLEQNEDLKRTMRDAQEYIVADLGFEHFPNSKAAQFLVLKKLNDRTSDLSGEYRIVEQEKDKQAMSDIEAELNEIFEYRAALYENLQGTTTILDPEIQEKLEKIPGAPEEPSYQNEVKKILNERFFELAKSPEKIQEYYDLNQEELNDVLAWAKKAEEGPTELQKAGDLFEASGYESPAFLERTRKNFLKEREKYALEKRDNLAKFAGKELLEITRTYYAPFVSEEEGTPALRGNRLMLESGIKEEPESGKVVNYWPLLLFLLPKLAEFLIFMFENAVDLEKTGYPQTAHNAAMNKLKEMQKRYQGKGEGK